MYFKSYLDIITQEHRSMMIERHMMSLNGEKKTGEGIVPRLFHILPYFFTGTGVIRFIGPHA